MTYVEWLVLINIREYLDEVELVLNIDIRCDKSMQNSIKSECFLSRSFEQVQNGTGQIR